MTWPSPRTGYEWPVGSDFVSAEPGIWQALDAQLAKATTILAFSVDDRKTKVPNPALNERYVVAIPSISETHVWDGKNWLIFDDRPKVMKPDASNALWYSGSDRTPLDIGSGELTIKTQRMGWHMAFDIFLNRAADSNRGSMGDYYCFWLPGGQDWWRTSNGGGWAAFNNTEVAVTPRMIAPGYVAAIKGSGGRIGENDLPGTGSTTDGLLSFGGWALTSGYTP